MLSPQPIAARTRLASSVRRPSSGSQPTDAAAEYANSGGLGLLGGLRRKLNELVDSPAFGLNGTQPGHVRPKTMSRTAAEAAPVQDDAEIAEAEIVTEAPGRESSGLCSVAMMRALLKESEERIGDRIGEQLHAAVEAAVEASITGFRKELTELKGRVSGMEGRMGSMEEKLHTHGTSVAALQGGLGAEKKARVATDKAVSALSTRLEEECEALNQQALSQKAQLDEQAAAQARLEKLVADMSTTLAEVQLGATRPADVVGRGGTGAQVSGGQSGGPLQRKLQEEGLAYGRSLKLVGLLGPAEQRQSGLALCQAAAKVLSDRLGGLAVTVERAIWLKVREGAAPKLLVVLSTMAMAHAVRGLRGAFGGPPSKLAGGERILDEFGPVELAVRDVLYKERGQVQGSWVGRSALMSREGGKMRAHTLSPAAMSAGFQAMQNGKRARAQAVQPEQRAQAVQPEQRAQAGPEGMDE
jgi:hypothetical protein